MSLSNTLTLNELIDLKADKKKDLNRLERDYAAIGDRISMLEDDNAERHRATDKRRHMLNKIGEYEDALIDIEAKIEKLTHGAE